MHDYGFLWSLAQMVKNNIYVHFFIFHVLSLISQIVTLI
jgi:hypothetical protein